MYLFLDSISYQPEGAEAPVLDRVSLYAQSGQIVSVVGPSGAGKSTLLRFVGKRSDGRDGVFMGSSGNPEWEPGQPMPEIVRGWRFCFPYDMFGPKWCTEEWRGVPIRRYAFPNMALNGSDREPPGKGEWFSWEGTPPNDENLPDLLLVDDLCGNPAFTDADARRAFVRELYTLRSRPEQRTVIYATRDGDDALAVSDCIAVLDGSRVVQFGTPAVVRDEPVNELVAQLFGRARHQSHAGDF